MAGINGREYQLATMEIALVGAGSTFVVESFRDVKYKSDRPKEHVKNHRGKNVGYVVKDEDTTGPSMRMLLSEWKLIKEWAAAQPGALPIGDMIFNASISYGDDPTTLMEDKIEGLMFQGEGRSASADQKELEIELALFIMHVHPHAGDFSA